jgi:2-polyprenyl-3-methyl-5-hydroxy-6-metoxy-1,4-benzoquinol methylase
MCLWGGANNKGVEEDKVTLYRELHQKSKDYGISGYDYIDIVKLAINTVKPKSVLDYGCGKGALLAQLKNVYPVINTDVLEHIPEECLPSVIERISMISQNCLFVLSHVRAVQVLSNGENAHCTGKPLFIIGIFSQSILKR